LLIENDLVLSGGSIKGAFQVGAIVAVLELGFASDFIWGIPVGSLNGSFLCNESGKQRNGEKGAGWVPIRASLEFFWKNNVRQPSDALTERSWINVGASALFDHFSGLVGSTPLQELVRRTISVENLRASKIKCKIGAANMYDGTITYADPSYQDFIEYLVASSRRRS